METHADDSTGRWAAETEIRSANASKSGTPNPIGRVLSVCTMTFRIKLDDDVFGLAFHQSVMAVGLITGHVVCHKVLIDHADVDADHANDDADLVDGAGGGGHCKADIVFNKKYHKGSCRAIDWSIDGNVLFTGGRDRSLHVLNPETGRLILRKLDAHSEAINALKGIDSHVVATGDDAGVVKLWDIRQRKVVMIYKENDDFISDFAVFPNNNNMIIAASADERISVFDIRKKKPIKVSDRQEDELLCVATVKNGKKAVVGTQDGVLSIFSYNNWGDCTDRLPGHPDGINTIAKLDEDRILTGSSDGLVRCIHILPNRLEKVLEGHEDLTESIEGLKIVPPTSSDEAAKWVAGFAHDGLVRFWSLEEGRERGDGTGLLAGDDDEENDSGDDSDSDDDCRISGECDLSSTYDKELYEKEYGSEGHGGISDQDEEDEDEDGESISDVVEKPRKAAPLKKKRESYSESDSDDHSVNNQQVRKGGKKKARRGIGGSRTQNFFADMD